MTQPYEPPLTFTSRTSKDTAGALDRQSKIPTPNVWLTLRSKETDNPRTITRG